MHKWNWPEGGGKLRKPLNFQLNPELGVRVLGKFDATLNFKSNQEEFELPVGPVTPETLGDVITEFPTVCMLRFNGCNFVICFSYIR